MEQDKLEKLARVAAIEIGLAFNESHCSGAPIHELTRALLDDAIDLGDIVEGFADIVAPIIVRSFKPK